MTYHTKGETQGQKTYLERKNPKTGFRERIIYTGSLKHKLTGWKILKKKI